MLSVGVRGHDFGTHTPEVLCRHIAQAGYTSLQLAFKKAIAGVHTLADITPQCVAQTKEALLQNGLHVSVLGCYVEPSLVDDALRKAHVDEFIAMLPVAKTLAATCIGTETTPMEKQPGVSCAAALLQLKRSLAQILPVAEELGVVVGLEPVVTHALATPELTQELLRDIASPNLKVIYDPVNLLSAQEVKTQHALWQRSMECFGADIVAVHMKGGAFDGETPKSVPFEQSVVDYEAVFAPLRKLPQPLTVLREEANPARAAQEIAFLTALCKG